MGVQDIDISRRSNEINGRHSQGLVRDVRPPAMNLTPASSRAEIVGRNVGSSRASGGSRDETRVELMSAPRCFAISTAVRSAPPALTRSTIVTTRTVDRLHGAGRCLGSAWRVA